VQISVAELDSMPAARAKELLALCCGASEWVSAMLARRPFGSREAVYAAADEIWQSLDREDWLEAFADHPRIGESKSAVQPTEQGSTWAAGEQSEVERAGDRVRSELARANREYEDRFGYIYIVCATGKSADEMLSIAHERLSNGPERELLVASEEQRQITRLRLGKLLDQGEAA
jgi:2-oxo-4-hydroxy-4-carboxy-5-ureidoimidazoline decarboxylase